MVGGLIFVILAVVAFLVARFGKFTTTAGGLSKTPEPSRKPNRIAAFTGAAFAVIAVIFLAGSSLYTQDAGEAKVLKDITGNIVGQNNSTGLQTKAPWVETVTFNIRNQQVVFAGKNGEGSDNSGGATNGPQITVQDRDGVSSNVDIALRYSIRPNAVTDIYREFLNEDNFKKSFIEQDVRSVVRLVPNSFSTIDLLTKRGEVETAVLEALEARWEDDGVVVDSISLQEIRPPESVVASYAAAQEAQINVTKEQANLQAQEVKAQQKVVNAQAEADANALLNASLSPQILQQRYLDTLKELAAAGNLVVTDGSNSGVLLNVER
ncbi:prohibitin family protein [Planctomonas deserti]|jgi:regulator of protease activity HflC (stomatin/prohibitin superfamily)|uniref:prohibitin family protein n=1 Tax=Planctomonas deserti TaxID=2144185 RepID=UPI000D336D54|nr:prohibitin family protein [Planctomonas deserti]